MKKVMLITGASGGIGSAVAELAAKQGYALCLHYFSNGKAALNLQEQLNASGTEAIALRADITREAEVMALLEETKQALGPVTVLVNNAGVVAPLVSLQDMTAERIRQVFDINVLGSFLCAREAIKQMSTLHGGQGGSIVNVSSVAARLGSPNEFLDYAASKGAIDTFTVGLAKEVAEQGIRVNAVRPGLIDTQIHARGGDSKRPNRLRKNIPMQRVGSAREVAEAVLFLASDSASYVSGAILDVAGGR